MPARTAISAVSRSRISPTMMTSGSCRSTVARALAKVTPVSARTSVWAAKPRSYSTGSSTVAKLAAALSIGEGLKVELVSADSFRIGSSEQIRVLGSLLDVPVKSALTPGELREAIAGAGDADVVLVDTAGRNYMHRIRMNELKGLLGAAEGVETYLVVSAALRRSAIRTAGEKFRACNPRGVVLTKLDETACPGGMADVPRLTGLGFAYLAWGQDVSKGIEKAESARMARLVMGCEAVEV